MAEEDAKMEVEAEVQEEAPVENGVEKEKEEAKAEEAVVDEKQKAKEEKDIVLAAKRAEVEEKKKALLEKKKEEEEAKAKVVEEARLAEVERLREKEEDAADDKRKKLSVPVKWNLMESTPNVVHSANGSLLMSVHDGGLQNLTACVRSNVGVKAGRYMFELKMIESHNKAAVSPMVPAQLVRVGFSTAGSSLYLGDGANNFSFDAQGQSIHETTKKQAFQKMGRFQVMAVVVNLMETGQNAFTVSMFVDGVRVCQPIPIPECFKGKAIFPTVNYKNVTLDANFGTSRMAALPFVCRTVQEAAAGDVEVVEVKAPKGGKHEVVFPIGLPDQGMFDWAQQFLENHPDFTELSDRKFIEWAAKSGIPRQGGYEQRSSLDKPEMNFKVANMDDLSIQAIMAHAAGALPRNYTVVECKSNLLAADRKAALGRFYGTGFKKIAVVLVGTPPEEYKEYIRELMIRKKQFAADAEKKKKKAIAEQKKVAAKRQKQAEHAKKAMEAKRKGEEIEPMEEDEDVAMEEEEETPVELTEEERAMTFRKFPCPDLTQATLSNHFADFSLPTSEEGFDEIRYVWGQADEAATHLKEWVKMQKRAQRVETLQPSTWFKETYASWQKEMTAWKKQQAEWKLPAKRKELLAKKKKAKAEAEAAEKGEGEEAAAEDAEEEEFNFEDIDVFAVESITDVGNGEGLFGKFEFEDWAMLTLRYEVDLLIKAFRKDLEDPERTSFHESHFAYYYTKYFKKQFNLKAYGVPDVEALLQIIKDTAKLEDGMLHSQLDTETPLDNFIKLTEEHRRDRQRRCDAGDESAELSLNKVMLNAASPPAYAPGARPQMQPGQAAAASVARQQLQQAQQQQAQQQQAQQRQPQQPARPPAGVRPQIAIVARPVVPRPGMMRPAWGGARPGAAVPAGVRPAATVGLKRPLIGGQPNMAPAKQPRPGFVAPIRPRF